MASTARTTFNRFKTSITPECDNLGRSIKTVSWVSVGLMIVSIILLFASIFVNYSGGGITMKAVGALEIIGAVIIIICLCTSVWTASIASKTTKQCLTG